MPHAHIEQVVHGLTKTGINALARISAETPRPSRDGRNGNSSKPRLLAIACILCACYQYRPSTTYADRDAAWCDNMHDHPAVHTWIVTQPCQRNNVLVELAMTILTRMDYLYRSKDNASKHNTHLIGTLWVDVRVRSLEQRC